MSKVLMGGITKVVVLGLICFILLFFLGTDSSPFYGEYFHYDSSVYYVMGKPLLEGYRPYIDYFDNKGILLYCLYAVGIAIDGSRTGVFILEWLFLFCSAMLVVGITKRINPSQRRSVNMSLIAFFISYFCLSEGPLTENFSLPLQFLSIYLYVGSCEDRRMLRFYGYGVCLALLFFIRPNNICFTLAIILCELFEGEGLEDCLRCLAKIVVGFLVIVIPILTISYNVGILFDMFDATISTNIRYRFDISPTDTVQHLYNFIRLLAVGAFSVIVFLVDKNKKMVQFAIVSIVIIILVYCTGKSFKHYFMIVIPLLSIGFGLLVRPQFRRSRYALMALMLLPFVALQDLVLPGALKCVGKLSIEIFQLTPPARIINIQKKEKDILNTLERMVPNNERNKIYVFNYWESLWIFQHFRSLPINKYSTASINKLAKYKSGIDYEVKTDFVCIKPLWILITTYNLNRYYIEIIEQEYTCMAKIDEGVYLYKRKAILPNEQQ